jgi:hypothetical protein
MDTVIEEKLMLASLYLENLCFSLEKLNVKRTHTRKISQMEDIILGIIDCIKDEESR